MARRNSAGCQAACLAPHDHKGRRGPLLGAVVLRPPDRDGICPGVSQPNGSLGVCHQSLSPGRTELSTCLAVLAIMLPRLGSAMTLEA